MEVWTVRSDHLYFTSIDVIVGSSLGRTSWNPRKESLTEEWHVLAAWVWKLCPRFALLTARYLLEDVNRWRDGCSFTLAPRPVYPRSRWRARTINNLVKYLRTPLAALSQLPLSLYGCDRPKLLALIYLLWVVLEDRGYTREGRPASTSCDVWLDVKGRADKSTV